MARHLLPSLLLLYPTAALAHWVLNQPVPVGEFDESTEATAPCGGGNPSNRDNVTAWPVGGFPVSLLTTHPAATWTFRVADAGAAPGPWTAFAPNVTQSGLGHVCFAAVPAPKLLVGRDAVVQIVQTAVDGALYQVRHCPAPAARRKMPWLKLGGGGRR